jgi:hypothetical protein
LPYTGKTPLYLYRKTPSIPPYITLRVFVAGLDTFVAGLLTFIAGLKIKTFIERLMPLDSGRCRK